MNDVELYGELIGIFVKKMTSPEIGQFRLETSSFRIILERARVQRPVLIKFTLTESGRIVNNLDDDDDALNALKALLKRSMDFISSLIGEELAKDIIINSMKDATKDIADEVRNNERFLSFVPEPFDLVLKENFRRTKGSRDHEGLLEVFEDIFHSYLRDLSQHTDLSAFKLKLSILREDYELLRHMEFKGNNTVEFDMEHWSKETDEAVSEALVVAFNSLVGLSTFLLGKEEAVKKATRIFQYYFEGQDELLERYDLTDNLLEGALYLKISTGIDELDSRIGGGITKGDSILFISPSGIERDIFTSGLLTQGLKGGSSVLMVISKEPPRSIRMLLRSQGLNADQLEEEGDLRIVDWFSWRGERIIGVEKEGHALKSSKILSNLGIAINKGLRELSFSTNKIAFVHVIGPAMNIFEFNQVYNFIQRLRAKFKEEEMASIFILESETMNQERKSRIMEVFDGVIELRKQTEKGKIRRELSVVSMSNIDFDPGPIPFMIRDNRIVTSKEAKEEEHPPEKKKESVGKGHPSEDAAEKEKVRPKRIIKKRVADGKKRSSTPRARDKKTIMPTENDVILLKEADKEERASRKRGTGIGPKVIVKKKKAEKNEKGVTPAEKNVRDKEKKVRKKIVRRIISSPKHSGGKGSERYDNGSQEEIINEAIATIDELLDSSESALDQENISRYPKKRTK